MPPRSPHSLSSPRSRSPVEGERIFAGSDGRIWGAALRYGRTEAGAGEPAVVFTCVTDARQAVRAVAVESAVHLRDASDDALRRWLADAPTVGKLS